MKLPIGNAQAVVAEYFESVEWLRSPQGWPAGLSLVVSRS